MNDRIEFIAHKGKLILLVDLSNCSAVEVETIVRRVPDVVMVRPPASVLILSDFTGASFNEEAVRAMKEAAVFDKPFIKRSAWVGARALPEEFSQSMREFSRRDFPIFETRDKALAWLIAE
jgi:hypothetical protein